jgi:hypothetical protein
VKFQQSRKIVYDIQGAVGTLNQGTSVLAANAAVIGGVIDQNSLLFDNRSTYYQVSTDMNYLASGRTYYTVGGTGYIVRRKSLALVGINGYSLRGSVNHRTSQSTTIGATFEHKHYDYPRVFGESDINSFTGSVSKQLGKRWKATISGGAYVIETQGTESVSIDPAIAALIGTSVSTRTFYKKDWLPTVTASLQRQFRHASLEGYYNRSVTPGNGVYLSSQQESYGGSFSYTGVRKWSFYLNVSSNNLDTVAQALAPYKSLGAGGGATYSVTKDLHLEATYQYRHQDVTNGGLKRDSSRVSIGLSFSPGDLPVSFH